MGRPLKLLAGERQPNESDKAVQGCNDFLRLGPGRTQKILWTKYTKSRSLPPTDSYDTIRDWSSKYEWTQRAAEYDSHLEEEKNLKRQQVMSRGLALEYERVEELERLVRFLKGEIYHKGETGRNDNVWLRDVKQVGTGEFAERVDIERFNAPIIDQFRGTLDDLAKETGGRIKKQEIAGKDGKALIIQYVNDWRGDEGDE